MDPAALINAKLEGQSFDRILHAVREGRETVSSLSGDHLDFLESMLKEVRVAATQFEEAIKRDDLDEVKGLAQSFQEILKMIEDSCESS